MNENTSNALSFLSAASKKCKQVYQIHRLCVHPETGSWRPKYLAAIWEYKEEDAFTFFDKMRTHLVNDLAKMNEKTLWPGPSIAMMMPRRTVVIGEL
jgi:hypothetical protein